MGDRSELRKVLECAFPVEMVAVGIYPEKRRMDFNKAADEVLRSDWLAEYEARVIREYQKNDLQAFLLTLGQGSNKVSEAADTVRKILKKEGE